MSVLPEICSSDYKHAPMTALNKHYYRVANKLLCDECILPFVYEQSRILAQAIYQHYQGVQQFKWELFRDPNNTLEFEDRVSMVNFMASVLGTGFQIQTKIWTYSSPNPDPIPTEPSILGQSNIKLLSTAVPGFTYNVQLLCYAFPDETSQIRYLEDSIAAALRAYIRSTMDVLTDEDVQMLISDEISKPYSSSAIGDDSTSDCPCGCHGDESAQVQGTCCKCGKGLTKPFYIYQNNAYCLEDMYAIVVDQIVESHLAEAVGITNDLDTLSANHRINNTPEWMISVISKYFNYMEGFTRLTQAYLIN